LRQDQTRAALKDSGSEGKEGEQGTAEEDQSNYKEKRHTCPEEVAIADEGTIGSWGRIPSEGRTVTEEAR
jgi:hypothetical protein